MSQLEELRTLRLKATAAIEASRNAVSSTQQTRRQLKLQRFSDSDTYLRLVASLRDEGRQSASAYQVAVSAVQETRNHCSF